MSNKVVTELTTNNSGLNTGLNSGEKSIRNYANRVTGMMRGVATSLAGFFAVQKLADFTMEVRNLSMEAEDAGSKFDTVFGPAVGKVTKFVEEFANMAGFAKHELKDLLGTSGNVLQGLGATEGQAAELAEGMARLAGDLASFNGATKDTPNVLRALQSALTGEREALKTYGIVITQAEVDTVALGMAGKKTAGDLTQLEKAQATVALAYEKAAKAVGDLERTQDSASNKAAARAARWKDLKVAIGDQLAPAFDKLGDATGAFVEELSRAMPVVVEFADAIGEWSDSLFDAGTEVDELGGKLTAFQSVTTRAMVAIQMAFERTFGNLAILTKGAGRNLGDLITVLESLATDGPMAASKTVLRLGKDAAKNPNESLNLSPLKDEFEKRVKDIEESFRLQNKDAARQRERAPREPRGPMDAPDAPGKATKDSGGRAGGTEGLEALYNRISGAASQNPQVKAVEKVKAAVDAGAEKIVEAIKGGKDGAVPAGAAAPLGPTPEQARADRADAINRIQQNRAAEERRRATRGDRPMRTAEDDTGEREGRQIQNAFRIVEAREAREKRMQENAARVKAANAERDAKLQEKYLQDVLAGRRLGGDDGAKALGDFAARRDADSGYRTVKGDSGPTTMGSQNRGDGRTPTATLDRIAEVEAFRRQAADRSAAADRERAIEAAAKQRQESEARIAAAGNVLAAAGAAGRAGQSGTADEFLKMNDNLGKAVRELEKATAENAKQTQQLQTLNAQIPQVGTLAR
jgi:hypothetical protein